MLCTTDKSYKDNKLNEDFYTYHHDDEKQILLLWQHGMGFNKLPITNQKFLNQCKYIFCFLNLMLSHHHVTSLNYRRLALESITIHASTEELVSGHHLPDCAASSHGR